MLETLGLSVEEVDEDFELSRDFDLMFPITPSPPSIQPSHSTLSLETVPETGLISIFSIFDATQN